MNSNVTNSGTARPDLLATARQRATAACTTTSWELDAALAVMERAGEELAALTALERGTLAHHAALRRLLSAQQLVSRISGKMP
jgi:hypothetical protein